MIIVNKHTGEQGDVAFEQLALFFNNNTVEWGARRYRPGMTKKEFVDALEHEGMFDRFVAIAFAAKFYEPLKHERNIV